MIFSKNRADMTHSSGHLLAMPSQIEPNHTNPNGNPPPRFPIEHVIAQLSARGDRDGDGDGDLWGKRRGKDGTGAAYRVMYWAVSSGGGGSQVIPLSKCFGT